jgi:hypothetical protein
MQFKADPPVLGAEQPPDYGWRTGIPEGQAFRGFPVFICRYFKIPFQHGGKGLPIRPEEFSYASFPFPVLGGVSFRKGVAPRSSMGVDTEIGFFLSPQIIKAEDKARMF